ncbi:TspO/MBR family protein [Brumimicrobium aurantiacum]|uniref:Tryptophan-rich sensory protein n=1 Tax=Brumimicrobium aurantiacum TaxID=1737063 RepID=A0A3E1EV69_9FLAO|nr:TspO/MBR family protein [Brumimicrobium aurantiacum]RFC53459.1 tryptophan-rich sensory protein [Brumimicrobium aurantiacum]
MQIHTGPHNTSSFKNGLWWKIVICSLACLGLGTLSGLSSMSGFEDWYEQLEKPFFTPPNWLFGPAWTILYILMGGSLAIIWQMVAVVRYPIFRKFAKRGIVIFIIHFLFNLAWTPVFFKYHLINLALVIIFIILAFIIILIRHFFRLDRLSAFLLIPYLLWVTFATALNLAIVVLN